MRRFILVCAFLLHAPAWAAPVSQAIKLDHFGYRPNDSKIAIFSQNPGASVQLRDSADQVVFTIPPGSIQAKGYDGPPSGDTVWWVDFSAFTTPGTYRLFSPALASQSYDFTIALDVYNPVVLAALKTFYYQRCNTPKPAVYAGAWADPQACHLTDKTTTHAAGHADHGILDLGGGWHDAGDYNKYVWAAAANAIIGLLQAYEDNPGHFRDGDLNIPESGNGVPDILDEVKWELDWFLKMQLADGSVLYQTHVDGFASNAPPSADANVRYYQNPTLESGAVFAGSLALAARVYAAAGMTVYADQLKTAALKTWSWLQTQGDSEHKAWAAAEVFRTAGTASARAYVDGFHANQWAGVFFDPGHYDVHAAVTYLQAPGATAAVVNQMRADFAALVDRIFSVNDLYRNGIQDWSYHWGTNAIRAWYGIMLLNAAKLGATGGQSAAACRLHAQDFLHFFHGQNALKMLYLSNTAALGGEHSSFQFYHAWFGDSLNNYSRSRYVGKPTGIIEPDYPYFKGTDNHGVSDNKTSLLGPAPGFVPGGPNKDYGGDASPPLGSVFYNRFYRDWNDQVQWTAMTWEITENSIGYQGPYVALGAYFMAAGNSSDEMFQDGFEAAP